MNAHDIMKDLSRKHKRLPKAGLSAAVTMRCEVAPLMLPELKRLLATFDANLDALTEKEFWAKMKQAVKKPSPLVLWLLPRGRMEAEGSLPAVHRTPELARGDASQPAFRARRQRGRRVQNSSPSSTTAIPLLCSSFSWTGTPAIPFTSGNGEP